MSHGIPMKPPWYFPRFGAVAPGLGRSRGRRKIAGDLRLLERAEGAADAARAAQARQWSGVDPRDPFFLGSWPIWILWIQS